MTVITACHLLDDYGNVVVNAGVFATEDEQDAMKSTWERHLRSGAQGSLIVDLDNIPPRVNIQLPTVTVVGREQWHGSTDIEVSGDFILHREFQRFGLADAFRRKEGTTGHLSDNFDAVAADRRRYLHDRHTEIHSADVRGDLHAFDLLRMTATLADAVRDMADFRNLQLDHAVEANQPEISLNKAVIGAAGRVDAKARELLGAHFRDAAHAMLVHALIDGYGTGAPQIRAEEYSALGRRLAQRLAEADKRLTLLERAAAHLAADAGRGAFDRCVPKESLADIDEQALYDRITRPPPAGG